MTSKVWPPPTAQEEAIAAEVINNPFQEECVSCGCWPCQCDWCGECGCEDCECETCSVCACVDCECSEVYVYYATHVCVSVDSDGDISHVRVASSLDEPYEVLYEDGTSVRHEALRARALASCRERDWPNWDID